MRSTRLSFLPSPVVAGRSTGALRSPLRRGTNSSTSSGKARPYANRQLATLDITSSSNSPRTESRKERPGWLTSSSIRANDRDEECSAAVVGVTREPTGDASRRLVRTISALRRLLSCQWLRRADRPTVLPSGVRVGRPRSPTRAGGALARPPKMVRTDEPASQGSEGRIARRWQPAPANRARRSR